jgi:hypothetical protein
MTVHMRSHRQTSVCILAANVTEAEFSIILHFGIADNILEYRLKTDGLLFS